MIEVPIGFFVFNRPETTRRVFDCIRQQRPSRLLIVADGPRSHVVGEADRCAEVRAIVSKVDWPCEVATNWSDVNIGCARRLATGLDWIFSHCESAIILEDDTQPNPSFFAFVAELLERFKDSERVGQVCGCTLVAETLDRETSYVISRFGSIWGWASWRRAWKVFDLKMQNWPAAKEAGLVSSVSLTRAGARARTGLYDRAFTGELGTWDYAWSFSRLYHGLLSVVPTTNLVANIGFGSNATHTRESQRAGLRGLEIAMPLRHPLELTPDQRYELALERHIAPTRFERIRRRLYNVLSP